MGTEQSNNVECPTCKGLGRIPSYDSTINESELFEDISFLEPKALIQHENRSNSSVTSIGSNLKLLTKMDIESVTDLLPEKAPLDNPKEVIKSILIRIKNTNPEEHKKAIIDAVQVSRYYQSMLKPYMNLINQKIVHFLNSQRTLNVRLACQSAGELFRTMRCTDRPIFDNIVTGLMYRTADKHQNVRMDANWALDKMILNITPVSSIKVIANCHHKNSAVKITQLRLLHRATVLADPMKILIGTGLKESRQLILKNCVVAVEDANSDIRFMSKKLMQLLMNTCNDNFCSALVHDLKWDELRVVEKVCDKRLNSLMEKDNTINNFHNYSFSKN